METTTHISQFSLDVKDGLKSKPKYLNSKYFYDDQGSRIFQKIMHMPEYYLTDCEEEIFETHKQQLFENFTNAGNHFEIVELGAGDGKKTRILIEHFINKTRLKYIPIDISQEAIDQLTETMLGGIPGLNMEGKTGDYFHMMEEINSYDHTDKVLMFLGSNIGNFSDQKAVEFLHQLREVMNPKDRLFIGFDLKKDPDVILKAYNDPHGYTAAFNLNLLRRINDELGANFELLKFKHTESYDPQTGTAKSFLVSREKQQVNIEGAGLTVHFDPWEPIFMERSQKYDVPMIQSLADRSGFEIVRNFTDRRKYFLNSLWRKRNG